MGEDFYWCPKLWCRLAGVSFYGLCSVPEGLAVKIKLFYGILQNFDIEKLKSFNGFYCQESQGVEILPTFAAKYD